eukprot:751091-Hanusia_phi.AAC.3
MREGGERRGTDVSGVRMRQLLPLVDVSASFRTDQVAMLDQAAVGLAVMVEKIDERDQPASRRLLAIRLSLHQRHKDEMVVVVVEEVVTTAEAAEQEVEEVMVLMEKVAVEEEEEEEEEERLLADPRSGSTSRAPA